MQKLHLKDIYKLGKLGERLSLRLNAKSFSHLAGNYNSKFRGQGLDFSSVRKYIIGDDIRNIDWKVTARTSKMHVKIFHEDRAREIYFLVDLGKEMLFASKGHLKATQAIFCAAILAFAALENNDHIGSYIISDQNSLFQKAQNSEKHLLKLLAQMLDNLNESIATKDRDFKPYLANNLHNIPRSLSKRSCLMIFTYIAELTEEVKTALTYLAHKREIFLFNITDPLDFNLPEIDLLSLQDGQNKLNLSIDQNTKKKYQQDQIDRQKQLKDFCRKQKINLQIIKTEAAIFPQIHEFLRKI